MKIKTLFISNKIKRLALAAFAFLSFTCNVHAQEGDPVIGEKLFNGNCASCHSPFRVVTGPALKGARQHWIDNSTEENFYAWIKNSAKVIASGDPYAKEMSAFDASDMTPQTVSDKQIDDIFAYIESAVEPVIDNGDGPVGPVKEEESSTLYWWLFAGLLVVIIAVVGGIKGNLTSISRDQDGAAPQAQGSVTASAKSWAWTNRGWFGVTVFLSMILLLAFGMVKWLDLGVYEDYKPVQPIAYSHEIHAGDLGIDCKYCHNAVTKSKHATIPSVNVCMNCHKTVTDGRTDEGTLEIAKIHSAAGYDVDTRTYSGETQPIEWVKVHNLPDHVYFNHSQHVVTGGIDCKQCHGNMKKQTVAKVMSTEDLNNVGVTDEDYDENKIKFTKPTLTMGWCIECHRESTVDIAGAPEGSYYNVIHERLLLDKKTYQKYLEDDVVTVGELGGLECAKCHY